MLLKVENQLGHGLLGHLRPIGQRAHGGSVVVEVLEHHAMGAADCCVALLGQTKRDPSPALWGARSVQTEGVEPLPGPSFCPIRTLARCVVRLSENGQPDASRWPRKPTQC